MVKSLIQNGGQKWTIVHFQKEWKNGTRVGVCFVMGSFRGARGWKQVFLCFQPAPGFKSFWKFAMTMLHWMTLKIYWKKMRRSYDSFQIICQVQMNGSRLSLNFSASQWENCTKGWMVSSSDWLPSLLSCFPIGRRQRAKLCLERYHRLPFTP